MVEKKVRILDASRDGDKEISECNGYVHYLDCDDDVPGAYICQGLSNCKLHVHLLYVNFNSKLLLYN